MIIFVLLVLWTILSYSLCNRIKVRDKKKIYCWNMFIVTTIIQGLRSVYIGGVDTHLVYQAGFERAIVTPFNRISIVFKKDILFYYLTKLFTYICTDFHVYVFVVSSLVLGSFAVFVYRHSDYTVFTYIIYYALGYYSVGFQMMRHVMALSVLLFAYDYLLDRKLIRFLAVVLFASCFHSSALIFLIAYPLSKMKINYKQWIGVAGIIIMAMFAKSRIVMLVNMIIEGMDRYSVYSMTRSQLSMTGAFILLCIYAVSFVFSYPKYKEDEKLTLYLNMSVISIVFMSMVVVVGEFHRISMFFGVYNTVLLPRAWTEYKISGKNLKYVYLLGICMILIAYYLFVGLDNFDLMGYRFFWSD